MKFEAAFNYMVHRGYAATLPEWGGFWSWDEESKTIVMHLRNGEILDLRDTPDVGYTFSFLFRDDWEILRDVGHTEHVENRLLMSEEETTDPLEDAIDAFLDHVAQMQEELEAADNETNEDHEDDEIAWCDCSEDECEVLDSVHEFLKAVAERDQVITVYYSNHS